MELIRDGKATCAYTYASGALPVADGTADRNTELSLQGNIAQQRYSVASLPQNQFSVGKLRCRKMQ